MAKAQKGKAEAYIKEAEALLAKKSWFSSSKERNVEEAAETYDKAANAYKVGGLIKKRETLTLKLRNCTEIDSLISVMLPRPSTMLVRSNLPFREKEPHRFFGLSFVL